MNSIENHHIEIVVITKDDEIGFVNTLESIYCQDINGIPILVVDGQSNSRIEEICRIRNWGVRYYYSEPLGISNAFNFAIRKVNAPYLLFLNSGDCFVDKTVYRKLTNGIENASKLDCKIVYGNYINAGRSGRIEVQADHKKLWSYNSLNHQSAAIEVGLAKKYEYDERLKLNMDYDFWLRCMVNNIGFYKIDDSISVFDGFGLGSSNEMIAYTAFTREVVRFLNSKKKVDLMDVTAIYIRFLRRYIRLKYRNLKAARN